jgi:hypothetical protein
MGRFYSDHFNGNIKGREGERRIEGKEEIRESVSDVTYETCDDLQTQYIEQISECASALP